MICLERLSSLHGALGMGVMDEDDGGVEEVLMACQNMKMGDQDVILGVDGVALLHPHHAATRSSGVGWQHLLPYLFNLALATALRLLQRRHL